MTEIQDETDYWSSFVVCYVIGTNPPIQVMDGFIRRVWKAYNVDKVVMVKKGRFIVRYTAMVSCDKVLSRAFFFIVSQ